MIRATAALPANHGKGKAFAQLTLPSDQRRLRRKVLAVKGEEVLVDFAEPVTLEHFGGLLLDDGRIVEVVAAPEPLYEVTGRGAEHLAQLAWHIGNRHLSAQIEKKRILVPRDHVVRTMLVGLGADVREITEPFAPERIVPVGPGPQRMLTDPDVQRAAADVVRIRSTNSCHQGIEGSGSSTPLTG